MYWNYYIRCVSCAMVVITCSVMCVCVCVCMGVLCNVWVFDDCVGVLVICALVFAVFYIVYTVFLYCFVYVYLILICFVCTRVKNTPTG